MVIESLIYPVASLLGIAVLTEATVEMVKTLVPKPITDSAKRVIAMLLAVIFSAVLNVSLFDDGNAYYIGVILAGMIASRGSNYIHSLSKILEVFTKK